MTAEQLAAYFGRKTAKRIPFSVCVERERDYVFWVYELEVTAVEEETIHVTVFLKGTHTVFLKGTHSEYGRWLLKNDVTRGDIEIPMRDGDGVSRLLGMAVAICGVAEKIERVPPSDDLRRCYNEYRDRVDELRAARRELHM